MSPFRHSSRDKSSYSYDNRHNSHHSSNSYSRTASKPKLEGSEQKFTPSCYNCGEKGHVVPHVPNLDKLNTIQTLIILAAQVLPDRIIRKQTLVQQRTKIKNRE